MLTFQNKSRSPSSIKAPIKNRNSRDDIRPKSSVLTGPVSWGDLNLDEDFQLENLTIKQADTVGLPQVCRHYGIEIDEYNTKIQCPFSFHNDSDPSFKYYSESNTFFCFGCKTRGGPVRLVSLFENISNVAAAEKLLDSFESEEVDTSICVRSKEKEELILKFSTIVRNFLREHNTPEALSFIDGETRAFDRTLHGRSERNVDIDGFAHVIDILEKRIGKYECLLP